MTAPDTKQLGKVGVLWPPVVVPQWMHLRDTARTLRETEARNARVHRRTLQQAREDTLFDYLSTDESEPAELTPWAPLLLASDSPAELAETGCEPAPLRSPVEGNSDGSSSDTFAISTYLRTHLPFDCESVAFYYQTPGAQNRTETSASPAVAGSCVGDYSSPATPTSVEEAEAEWSEVSNTDESLSWLATHWCSKRRSH